MKKKILCKMNMLLAALIALLLPSCRTQKNIPEKKLKEEPQIREEVRVMYGTPPAVYEELRRREMQDSLQRVQEQQTSADTVLMNNK